MTPIRWGDEEWLSFIEERSANARVLRVIKVQNDCQYRSESPLPVATCQPGN
jgi:hypothetical protein